MKKFFLFIGLLSIFNLKPCDLQSFDTFFTNANMEFNAFMEYGLPGYDFQIDAIIKQAEKKLTNQQFKFLLSNFLAIAFLKGDFLIIELLIAYEELQITTGHFNILYNKYSDDDAKAKQMFEVIKEKVGVNSDVVYHLRVDVREWVNKFLNRTHPTLIEFLNYSKDDLALIRRRRINKKLLQPVKHSLSAPYDLSPRPDAGDEKTSEE